MKINQSQIISSNVSTNYRLNQTKENQDIKNIEHRDFDQKVVSTPLKAASFGINLNNRIKPANNMIQISFGNAETKKTNQILQIPPELQSVLDGIYKKGGLANVAMEAPASWQNADETANTNIDVRTILPYNSFNDNVQSEESKGVLVLDKKATGVNEVNKIAPKNAYKRVATDYQLKDNESFVISDGNNFREIERLDNYKGTIKGINQEKFELEEIPYQLFKLKTNDIKKNATKGEIYFLHTPEVAQLPEAYGGPQCAASGSGGWTGETGAHFLDLDYSNFSRASVDVLPKLKDEGFEPANIWIHDRFGVSAITDMGNRGENDDYFEGLRVHTTFHNVGGAYQGKYSNPIDFFNIIADEKDYEKLKNTNNGKDLEFIKKIRSKMIDMSKEAEANCKTDFDPFKALDKKEQKAIYDIFDPYIGMFKDDDGNYNMSAIPLTASETQNKTFSSGTVSMNYGLEARNPKTPEMSEGMQKRFEKAKDITIDITNGSSLKTMETDKPYTKIEGKATKFGPNGCGFEKTDMVKYKPFSQNDSIDDLYKARQFNKNTFYNTLTQFSENKSSNDISENSINKLFFNDDLISKKGNTVIGYIQDKRSELNGKDPIILMGWGRGTEQKGYPISLEGFKQFLENKNISEAEKKRVNVILGGQFNNGSSDWKLIQKQIKEINSIDNGKYKGQAIYVNGWFANKLVTCADFAYLTSRFEPCGITPIESLGCGTPVLSTNTGGAPNLIEEGKTGFLTKNAFLIGNKEDLLPANKQNLKGNELANAIDEVRINKQGSELSELIEKAIKTYDDKEVYKKMSKACIEHKGDWYNNLDSNNGLSANDRYFQQVWQIDKNNGFKGLPDRTKDRLKPVVGEKFGIVPEDVYKSVVENSKKGNKTKIQSQKITEKSFLEKLKDSKLAKVGIIGTLIAAGGVTAAGLYLNEKNKEKSAINTDA